MTDVAEEDEDSDWRLSLEQANELADLLREAREQNKLIHHDGALFAGCPLTFAPDDIEALWSAGRYRLPRKYWRLR